VKNSVDIASPIGATIRDYHARVRQAEDNLNSDLMTIDALLSRHSTLAPALRDWPTLWELLPTDVKNKHNKEVKPRSAQENVVPVDITPLKALTGQLILNKLAEDEKGET